MENAEIRDAIASSVEGLLAQHYSFETRQSVIAADRPALPGFWARLAEMGLFGIELPAEAGGIDASFEELASVLEAFGRALVLEPFVATAVIGVGLIKALGNTGQQSALLGGIVEGKTKVALAHGAGQLAIEPAPSGWRITGQCQGMMGGDEADILLVAASGKAGLSLAAVPAAHAGVRRACYRLYDGRGAADLAIDAVIDDSDLLGGPGSAGPAIELAQDRGAAAIIHEALGAMDKLLRMTSDYLKTRNQFGQNLIDFQALQHKLVDMWMAVEQARSMAQLATAAVAEGDDVNRAVDISSAKIMIGDCAKFVGETAVQLHGGIALTAEYPAGHYFKRLTMIRAEFGDELYHLERIARLST